jgi:signal transduction histidine kinase
MKNTRTTRVRQILATVVIAFLAMMTYFIVSSYRTNLKEAEAAALMRLGGIVNSLALQIDGDAHQYLTMKYLRKDGISSNTQDSLYQQIHQMLKRNYQANMLHSPIYTIIYDTLSSNYAFAVTSAEQPYYRHAYNSAPKILMEKHYEGAMIPMYKDEFGTWLSAFSIIKNKSGQVVGLVQADEKFDDFLKRARQNTWNNIMVSLIVFGVLMFVLLQILQPILRREKEDKEMLAQANEQIRQIDDFRKEMIANISHDLRTPMASITGFAETLLNKNIQLSDNERFKYLKIIQSETKKLNTMIAELFDLTKIESGQIILQPEPFSISELGHDILYKYTALAKEQNIRLLTEIDENLPFVFADLKWIDRVVQNLMDNAIKFVNDGGMIKFTIKKVEEKIHFKVCNSGQPIDNQHIPHIFDRYFKSTSTRSDSTGLGLAIVKKIIDLHEENVWCEVNDNITTFQFTMPTYDGKK